MSEAERLAMEFDWWVARGLNLEPRLADAAAELRRLASVEAELEALKKAISEAEPGAWMHDDGRVVTSTTMNIALRDGGAMASSLAGYTQPLYTLKGIK